MQPAPNRGESALEKSPEIHPQISSRFEGIREILGGASKVTQPLRNDMDLVRLARTGVSKASMLNVAKLLGVTLEKMSSMLHISPRTIQRKENNELMGVYTSEQTIEMAQVIYKGTALFGSQDACRKWLYSSLVALGGKRPIDLLDTTFGINLVMAELGRLEYGVFS